VTAFARGGSSYGEPRDHVDEREQNHDEQLAVHLVDEHGEDEQAADGACPEHVGEQVHDVVAEIEPQHVALLETDEPSDLQELGLLPRKRLDELDAAQVLVDRIQQLPARRCEGLPDGGQPASVGGGEPHEDHADEQRDDRQLPGQDDEESEEHEERDRVGDQVDALTHEPFQRGGIVERLLDQLADLGPVMVLEPDLEQHGGGPGPQIRRQPARHPAAEIDGELEKGVLEQDRRDHQRDGQQDLGRHRERRQQLRHAAQQPGQLAARLHRLEVAQQRDEHADGHAVERRGEKGGHDDEEDHPPIGPQARQQIPELESGGGLHAGAVPGSDRFSRGTVMEIRSTSCRTSGAGGLAIAPRRATCCR